MTCASVGAEDGVVVPQDGAGFVEVGQFAVGEDDNAVHKALTPASLPNERGEGKKNPPGAEDMVVKYVPSASMIWIR
ncbi:MAG: hypothetical protein Kow0070_13760 [Anaerolineales bacterium]